MERINGNGKIGGRNADGSPKILCIDETHFPKLKNAKGGGHSRVTEGHQTVVMAGVELTGTWKGRKTTGRQFLVIIADKDMATFRAVIEAHVLPGTLIWTDGHASYGFLDTHPDYTQETVIHRRGIFARRREDGVIISSNAIEGLFARLKRMMRAYRATPNKETGYALYLGEFMWRTRFLSTPEESDTWRRNAFWQVLRAINAVLGTLSPGEPLPMAEGQGEAWQEMKDAASRLVAS